MITEEQAIYYSNYLQNAINSENLEEAVNAANMLADCLVTLQINVVEVKPLQVNIPQMNIPQMNNPQYNNPPAYNQYQPGNPVQVMPNQLRNPQGSTATMNPTIGVRQVIAPPPVNPPQRPLIISPNPTLPIHQTLPPGFNNPIPFLHQGINQPILPHLNPNLYPAPRNYP